MIQSFNLPWAVVFGWPVVRVIRAYIWLVPYERMYKIESKRPLNCVANNNVCFTQPQLSVLLVSHWNRRENNISWQSAHLDLSVQQRDEFRHLLQLFSRVIRVEWVRSLLALQHSREHTKSVKCRRDVGQRMQRKFYRFFSSAADRRHCNTDND